MDEGQALAEMEHSGSSREAATARSIRLFTDGKTIALLKRPEGEIWVRVPYSSITCSDEKNWFEVLSLLQANRNLDGHVPRPVVTGTVDGVAYYPESEVDGMRAFRNALTQAIGSASCTMWTGFFAS